MEEVIIKIELEKVDNERQIDNISKKLIELQTANKNLIAQNKELAKQGKENSQEYIENTRQIEINKQKISEATATRKGLIQTLIAEDNSIKALRVRNAELIKQRDLLNTSTATGKAQIAAINAELDRNNKVINDNSSALEKQRFNIGNYKSALDAIVPGLGKFIDGIEGATKASLTFIATPIGLVLAAVAGVLLAVSAYFKRTEEGGDKLNKIIFTMEAIFGQLMDVASDVGRVIVAAFENPKKAIQDLGNFIKDNLINRIEGFFELIPKFAEAIGLLFEGEFTRAGEVALNAIGKVALGVEDTTGLISDFINETGKLVDEALKQGARLSELDKLIGDQERELTIQRARTALEVARIREDALKLEGEERKKRILEAVELEERLSNAEVAAAQTRLQIARTEQEINGVTGVSRQAVADAEAAVINAQTARFQNTLRFQKEIAALDKAELDRKLKLAEEEKRIAQETFDFYQKLAQETFDRESDNLENAQLERLNTLKEGYFNDLLAKEEFEAQLSVLEITALEERKAFLEANGMETLAIETALIDAKIKNKEREVAAEKAANDQRIANERALTNSMIGLAGQFGNVITQIAGKNKYIAIAGIVIEKAAALAQIIANTAIANAKAVAASPLTFGMPWVGINTASGILAGLSVVAEAASSISAINSTKFRRGGIAQTGGVLSGPLHAQGGIPFTVGGRPGFEAEGDEIIINRKSSKMFRRELSAINVAGGGVPFGRGGVTRYQTGSIITGTATQQSGQLAETRSQIRDTVESVMRMMPPIVVTVEDINAKQNEVSETTMRATVI